MCPFASSWNVFPLNPPFFIPIAGCVGSKKPDPLVMPPSRVRFGDVLVDRGGFSVFQGLAPQTTSASEFALSALDPEGFSSESLEAIERSLALEMDDDQMFLFG